MYSSEECRKRAQECIEQSHAVRPAESAALRKLAQSWLVLADQTDELTRQTDEFSRLGTKDPAER